MSSDHRDEHAGRRSREAALVAAVCNFGWGSVGKLRLILDELANPRVVIHGDVSWARAVQRLLAPRQVTDWSDAIPDGRVALVINDPHAADTLSAYAPVIYVDSLPYLWATPAEIPRSVTIYCAQRSPVVELPPGNPLVGRSDITWINPIIPRPQSWIGGMGVVINVGGLHSHLSGSADIAYTSLVVLPLVALLRRAGIRVSAVCGKLPSSVISEVHAVLGAEVVVGPQTPYQFEETLRRADVLLTSPGSTTILQAAALRLPTVLLPPQNLSQVLNTEIYASPETPIASWPPTVLDRSEVERLRPHGEDTVLQYVYGAIRAAAESPNKRAEVAARLREVTASLHDAAATLDRLVEPRASGAVEVARLVEQLSCDQVDLARPDTRSALT